MITWILSNWKLCLIGIIIIILGLYIGSLKIENSLLEKTVKEQKEDIANKAKLIDNLDAKLAGKEASISSLQDQNKKLLENNRKYVENLKKIDDTLKGVKDVPKESTRGVMPDETSDKIIDIYNDIFAPFRK